MTQEPNPELLTEADVAIYFGNGDLTFGEVMTELRERGLIVPEPVDPFLEEAREVVAKWAEGIEGFGPYADDYRSGKRDKDSEIQTCISALRRGIEIGAQRPLTREMVREAVIGAKPDLLTPGDFICSTGSVCRRDAEGFLDRLHAALTEIMKGEAK
jgi:hypothetical protein